MRLFLYLLVFTGVNFLGFHFLGLFWLKVWLTLFVIVCLIGLVACVAVYNGVSKGLKEPDNRPSDWKDHD